MVVRQRKPYRRKDGLTIYFEDNAGVIVNPKGDMKGALPHHQHWTAASSAQHASGPESGGLFTCNISTLSQLPRAGSAIAGPVAKECADIWPRIASAANCIV